MGVGAGVGVGATATGVGVGATGVGAIGEGEGALVVGGAIEPEDVTPPPPPPHADRAVRTSRLAEVERVFFIVVPHPQVRQAVLVRDMTARAK